LALQPGNLDFHCPSAPQFKILCRRYIPQDTLINAILKKFLFVSSIYLLGQLKGQLGVTDAQAIGGTGALLQLEQNQLGTGAMSSLTSEAPGLSSLLGGGSSLSKSLLSNISSMSGVQSTFSALGMNSAMIQQFVPIVLSFLGEQGVGSPLLGQLQSLWAPAG